MHPIKSICAFLLWLGHGRRIHDARKEVKSGASLKRAAASEDQHTVHPLAKVMLASDFVAGFNRISPYWHGVSGRAGLKSVVMEQMPIRRWYWPPSWSSPVQSLGRPVRTKNRARFLTRPMKVRSKHHLQTVQNVFPGADFVDVFTFNVQNALASPEIGIQPSDAIAICGLSRDASTNAFQAYIDSYFGASFNAHGLGGLWNMGQIGMKGAFSHSPLVNGKERYVFFAMPHIAINANGTVGEISRPGRSGSSACGALIECMNALKSTKNSDWKSLISPDSWKADANPEFTTLLSKLARRMRGTPAERIDLISVTKETLGLIEDDLNKLIRNTVDTKKADYAVVTGIQVHSSADEVTDEEPVLEFIVPGKAFAVVNNKRTNLDLPDGSASLARLAGLKEGSGNATKQRPGLVKGVAAFCLAALALLLTDGGIEG